MEPYIDYRTAKENLSIIRVAEQLGYALNRSEGLAYPVYELWQGDSVTEKVVITHPNDPSRQGYFVRNTGERGDLISFIEHRLDFFNNAVGTTNRERINHVLTGLIGSAPAQTTVPTRYAQARQEVTDRPFSPDRFEFTPIHPSKGVELLEERGLTRETLELFHPFVGWVKEEGKPQYNLAFPYRIPGHAEVVNFELRYKKADGTNGKLFSKGGNRKESAFIAQWNPRPDRIKQVYLFEAVIDLMSFVQLHPGINRNHSAFVAFGGAITREQITGVRDYFTESNFTTCYDNDRAGHQFDICTAAYLLDREVKIQKRRNQEVYDVSFWDTKFDLPKEALTLENVLKEARIFRIEELSVMKPTAGKDWNDQLNVLRSKEGFEILHLEKLESYRESHSPIIHSSKNNRMETTNEKQEKAMEPKFQADEVDWQELKKIGIHEDFLSKVNDKTGKSPLDQLLETGKTGIINAYHKVSDTLTLRMEGKLSLYQSSDGQVKMAFDSVKKFLDIPDQLLGYTFSEEDRKNLSQENNLFKLVELQSRGGKTFNAYIGVDPDMKTLTMALPNEIYFRKCGGIELSEEQQAHLKTGNPLYIKDMKKKDGTLFSCYVAVDPSKKGLTMYKNKPSVVQTQTQTEERKEEKKQRRGKRI